MNTVYCRGNVKEAIDAQLDIEPITGVVLLKPNMVDPSIPDACSNPNRMQDVVDSLRSHGATEVYIYDQPAAYVFENGNVNLQEAYEALGYDRIEGARVISQFLAQTSYKGSRLSAVTAERQEVIVPVYNTVGLQVVSMSLPKHHGNYNFSGTTKNLMGLIPQEARMRLFHSGFLQSAEAEGLEGDELGLRMSELLFTFAEKYTALYGGSIDDPESGFVPFVHNACVHDEINTDALASQLEHVMNAGVLVGLHDHFSGLYVLDGTQTMVRQEHAGELVDTNFAVVGKRSEAVDMVGMHKLGIPSGHVPYLSELLEREGDFEINGDVGESMGTPNILNRELITDVHGLNFLAVPA